MLSGSSVREAISTSTSRTGLAGRPGTAVLPTWWMARATSPSAAASTVRSASKDSGHPGS
jgi:hypothetical protein